mgnify:CR=1 FL=1
MKRNVKRLNIEWLAKVTLAVALILSCSNVAVADTTIVDGNTNPDTLPTVSTGLTK